MFNHLIYAKANLNAFSDALGDRNLRDGARSESDHEVYKTSNLFDSVFDYFQNIDDIDGIFISS
jgi:hypothetical protein